MKVSTSRFITLDSLRAIGSFLVILAHSGYPPMLGWCAVQWFFVLSGYLITGILIQNKKLTFGEYIKRFFWRRALRIFPLYFAYVGILILSYWVIGKPETIQTDSWALMTYSYNFLRFSEAWKRALLYSHFWSLCVEEHFYFIWPFAVYFLSLRSLKKLLIVIVFAAPLSRFIMGHILSHYGGSPFNIAEKIYWFTLNQADALALGAAIAAFGLDKKMKHAGRVLAGVTGIFLVLGLACFLNNRSNTNFLVNFGYPFLTLNNHQHIWAYTLINLISAVLIIFLTQRENAQTGAWYALLSQPAIVKAGQISYGLYVYHMAVILAFHPLQATVYRWAFGRTLFTMAICLSIYLVARLSYRFYEAPFLKLKDSRHKFLIQLGIAKEDFS